MALEISEIGIRMHVRDGASDPERGDAGAPDAGHEEAAAPLDRDEIVEDCVRRVLRLLKSAQER